MNPFHPSLIALLMISTCASTLAGNFTGTWQGTGDVFFSGPFTPTSSSPCTLIEIKLEHLEGTSLNVRNYHAICGTLDSEWGPIPMGIQGTDVFEQDERTGTLVDDTLLTLTSDGGVKYAFNLKLFPATATEPLKLQSYYGVQNLVGTIVIEGFLHPVSP